MSAASPNYAPGSRQAGRRLALQGLYQWQLTGDTPKTIYEQFAEEAEPTAPLPKYFHDLLFGVIEQAGKLDEALQPYLSRPLAQVDPVEAAVLRLAAFELVHCPEIPYRVVINEALDMEHDFGATDAHKFVNGVLDKLAQQVRATEIAARQASRPASKTHATAPKPS